MGRRIVVVAVVTRILEEGVEADISGTDSAVGGIGLRVFWLHVACLVLFLFFFFFGLYYSRGYGSLRRWRGEDEGGRGLVLDA